MKRLVMLLIAMILLTGVAYADVDSNNSCESAQSWNLDTYMSPSLNSGNDPDDYYEFSLPSKGTITISADNNFPNPVNIAYVVYQGGCPLSNHIGSGYIPADASDWSVDIVADNCPLSPLIIIFSYTLSAPGDKYFRFEVSLSNPLGDCSTIEAPSILMNAPAEDISIEPGDLLYASWTGDNGNDPNATVTIAFDANTNAYDGYYTWITDADLSGSVNQSTSSIPSGTYRVVALIENSMDDDFSYSGGYVTITDGSTGGDETGTEITGHTVSGSEVWTLDESPYIVTGKVIIPSGTSLTIEPGVYVDFSTSSNELGMFVVTGTLTADGVTFDGDQVGSVNTWAVVEMRTSGSLYLTDCTLFGRWTPTSSGGKDWRGVHVTGNYTNAVMIDNCSFTGFNNGITSGRDSHLDISNCSFNYCNTGIGIQYGTVDITRCTFDDISDNCISLSGGPQFVGAVGTVSGCKFTNSPSADGVRGNYDANATITNSCFSGLGTAVNNASSNLFMAENNWWNSANGPTHDDNTGGNGEVVLGNVDYDPWLDDCDQTIPVISYGTTVIVHGYIMAPDGTILGDIDNVHENGQWTLGMAEAICHRMSVGVIYTIENGIILPFKYFPANDHELALTGEKVIVFDWIKESDKGKFGFLEGAADALFASLIKGARNGDWSLKQLHFIGHSRGAVVCSETIQRLGFFKEANNLPIEISTSLDNNIHFTVLDGHPMDRVEGDCIGDFGALLDLDADDYEVNKPMINWFTGEYLDYKPQAIIVWGNVGLSDNYFQGVCGDFHAIPNGIHRYFGLSEGVSNVQLDTIWSNVSGSNHSAVHKWYTGTINRDINTEWYPNNESIKLGFNKTKSLTNSDFGDYTVESRFSYSVDKSLKSYKIFNGDFSMGQMVLDMNPPGWSFQGGSGEVSITSGYLRLRGNRFFDFSKATHNEAYIPQNATHLAFWYKVADDDDLFARDFFRVYFDDYANHNPSSFSRFLDEEDDQWIYRTIDLADYFKGSAHTITFDIVNSGETGDIDSKVWVDDIHFVLDGEESEYYKNLQKYNITCPVSVVIIDPLGRVINSDSTEIPGAQYWEYEIVDGDTAKTIEIPNSIEGLYRILIEPKPYATPDDTYSIEVLQGTSSIVIAVNELIANIPPNGYLFSTLDTGSVFGLVSDSTTGLHGVVVDLYDSDGNVVTSTTTDELGSYQFAGIDNGSYSVLITPPLGFISEETIKEVTVVGLPVEVNFELQEIQIAEGVFHCWWWKKQFELQHIDGIHPSHIHITPEDVDNYNELVFDHFYSRNDEYAIRLESITYTDNPARPITYEEMSALFLAPYEDSFEYRYQRSLRTNLLNIASGRMSQTKIVSADGATASQAIICLIGLYETGERKNMYYADVFLQFMHAGWMIPAGYIDLDTPNIMFKEGDEIDTPLPTEFSLHQNYPNPFNPMTEISFSLPTASNVTLEIFNITGQKVTTLADRHFGAGNHIVTWDASNYASGVYFYRLEANNFIDTKKMTLIK